MQRQINSSGIRQKLHSLHATVYSFKSTDFRHCRGAREDDRVSEAWFAARPHAIHTDRTTALLAGSRPLRLCRAPGSGRTSTAARHRR